MKLPFLAGAALALALTVPAAAATYLFDSGGDTASITFNGMENGIVDPNLGTTLDLTLVNITSGGLSYNFSYTIENTSTGVDSGSRVTSFGGDVDPNFSSVSGISGTFTSWNSGNVPGVGSVELCITNVTCAGGGGGGVNTSSPGSGLFTMNFTAPLSAGLTFTARDVKYQSTGLEQNGSATGIPVGVPEPATWALMIMGIGGIGAVMRRRRTQPVLA
jgi:hypothetical protein